MLKKIGKADNKCPDCLYLDAQLRNKTKRRADLHITAYFNYERHTVPGGEFIFGIRGGDLRLDFEKGKLCKFHLTSDFNYTVEKRGTSTTKTTSSRTRSSTFATTISKDPSGTREKTKEISESQDLGRANEASFTAWQVSAIRGPHPGWRFVVKDEQDYLEGNITTELFARIESRSPGNSMTVTFTTEQHHIFTNVTAGALWKHGMRDIRRLRLGNFLIWRTIRPMVMPYVSQVRFSGATSDR